MCPSTRWSPCWPAIFAHSHSLVDWSVISSMDNPIVRAHSKSRIVEPRFATAEMVEARYDLRGTGRGKVEINVLRASRREGLCTPRSWGTWRTRRWGTLRSHNFRMRFWAHWKIWFAMSGGYFFGATFRTRSASGNDTCFPRPLVSSWTAWERGFRSGVGSTCNFRSQKHFPFVRERGDVSNFQCWAKFPDPVALTLVDL